MPHGDGGGDHPALPGFTAPLALAALVLQRGGTASAITGGLALFLAGLPHGAFAPDHRALLSDRDYVRRYLAAGALTAGAFVAAPVPALGGFLVLSANHLLHDPSGGEPARRVALAGLLTGGSALVRPSQTARVFATLCGRAVPRGMTAVLGVTGAVGYGAALARARRARGDSVLLVTIAAPVLLHPVLATGMIFMLGHAAPVTAAIMRTNGWGRGHGRLLAVTGGLLSLVTVRLVAPRLRLLPVLAAGALAVIMPHLLPSRWLRRPAGTPSHKAQAATSAAT